MVSLLLWFPFDVNIKRNRSLDKTLVIDWKTHFVYLSIHTGPLFYEILYTVIARSPALRDKLRDEATPKALIGGTRRLLRGGSQ